ncbi:PadR family transcriptional regulator [Microlunatus elymi]|uniref:PadR family transcriptional regulator n=1 Tax=Microlunatus elymi TaxID=2596828 RepID=A0A516Q2L1_9ACTN|nr:PadR family transcriptional regulator [Microlunatus elymi]QDP97656.1 PadR family transcriptional regulator [Microlunatus elymi]
MSLRFALLGLLNERPCSGYDLTRRFEEGIGAYAWHAQHSQIYPELKKLLADDLIRVAEEGARGRKTYAITDQGADLLREWLLQRPTTAGVRNEYVLRLFLLPALPPADAEQVLHKTIEFAEEQITLLTGELDEIARVHGDTVGNGAMAAQYGLRVYRATIDWAHWAIARLADGEHGADGLAGLEQ